MGIRRESDQRGRTKIILSKYWPDGSRFRRRVKNMSLARTLETQIDAAITLGTWEDLKQRLSGRREDRATNPSLKVFGEEYLAYCKSRNRDVTFKRVSVNHITRLIGHIRLSDVRRRHADQLADARLGEGADPSTVNRNLAVLKHMITVALEREYLTTHPLLRYRMLPKAEEALRIMNYDEYRRLIDAVANEDLTIGAYVALLGETGLRKQEGLRARWTDIHGRVLVVGKTKNGRVRSVPLSDLAGEWLSKLVRYIDDPHLFINPGTGKPFNDPRRAFNEGKNKAGLSWVRGFHDLRHFRATMWLKGGADVRTVKELLGHRSIQTTMRYLHYVQSHAVETVTAIQVREEQAWKELQNSQDKNRTICSKDSTAQNSG
jgi:integrase